MAVFKVNEVYAGRYLLEKLIGEGGFSEVWKAKDIMADEATVAIKIYAPEKGLEEFGIKQFRKEYSITHHLSHPHLIRVFYFDISDRSPYLIMPYYKLGSLSNLLYERGTFDEKQIALFMYQVGGALEELHRQDPIILHQDIKPDNILIQELDHFILTDFGISSQTRHTLSKSTGSFKSLTIAYAPPERFDRNPASNEASDIFSFGVTLYETCTGQVPWEGNGGQSLLKGAQIPDLPSKFPRELNKMIQACMCLDSSERPTATAIKSWGKFFLDNSYWQYSLGETRKNPQIYKILFTVISILFVVAIAGFIYIKTTNTRSNVPLLNDTIYIKNNPVNGGGGNDEPFTATNTLPVNQDSLDQHKNVDTVRGESVKSKNVEMFLNKISDPSISRTERKNLKKEALLLFENHQVMVLENKDGISNRHTISELLDLLINIPHKVKIVEVLLNGEEKITELQIELTVL